MTDEIPATTPANEQSPPEVVANPQFITWKHPPYCELCNVHFSVNLVRKHISKVKIIRINYVYGSENKILN